MKERAQNGGGKSTNAHGTWGGYELARKQRVKSNGETQCKGNRAVGDRPGAVTTVGRVACQRVNEYKNNRMNEWKERTTVHGR